MSAAMDPARLSWRRARRVLAAAAATYVPACVLLATSAGALVLVIGFLLSGVGIGLGETAPTAWLATVLQDSLRADGFGVLGVAQAFG
jgi:MFS family permease